MASAEGNRSSEVIRFRSVHRLDFGLLWLTVRWLSLLGNLDCLGECDTIINASELLYRGSWFFNLLFDGISIQIRFRRVYRVDRVRKDGLF